jgi:Domain of unknown function (DUF5658)
MNPLLLALIAASALGAWIMQDDAGAGPASTNERLRSALGLFLILQILDLGTTLAVFKAGGLELNPVVRTFMPWVGRIPAIIVSKVVLVVIIVMLSRRVWLLRFANIYYSGIVLWNAWVLHLLKLRSA